MNNNDIESFKSMMATIQEAVDTTNSTCLAMHVARKGARDTGLTCSGIYCPVCPLYVPVLRKMVDVYTSIKGCKDE